MLVMRSKMLLEAFLSTSLDPSLVCFCFQVMREYKVCKIARGFEIISDYLFSFCKRILDFEFSSVLLQSKWGAILQLCFCISVASFQSARGMKCGITSAGRWKLTDVLSTFLPFTAWIFLQLFRIGLLQSPCFRFRNIFNCRKKNKKNFSSFQTQESWISSFKDSSFQSHGAILTWFLPMSNPCFKMIQVTDSVHGGVVSDPEYR